MNLLFEIVLFIIVGYICYECGKTDGRIETASGEYSCSLVIQKDKTTVWDCKKAI